MSLMQEFEKERDEAVRSLDVENFKIFYRKWKKKGFYRVKLPADNIIEAALYKMLYRLGSATPSERTRAKNWLLLHGYQI